jgi:hypothetical protein
MILLAASAVFFWLLGYYAVRLSFTLVPPLVMLIALEQNAWSERSQAVRRFLPGVNAAAVLLWCLATAFEALAA